MRRRRHSFRNFFGTLFKNVREEGGWIKAALARHSCLNDASPLAKNTSVSVGAKAFVSSDPDEASGVAGGCGTELPFAAGLGPEF